jgi:hypothetical protein
MTRIASYSFYECPACNQWHLKPEYGSINTNSYIPSDLYIRPEEIKKCKKCGEKRQLSEYIHHKNYPKERYQKNLWNFFKIEKPKFSYPKFDE